MMACCIISNPVVATSEMSRPVAEFSPTHPTVPAGYSVQFFDESSNVPTSWKWYVGGSLFSIAQNPVYLFGFAGLYGVTLISSNSFGASDPVSHTVQVL